MTVALVPDHPVRQVSAQLAGAGHRPDRGALAWRADVRILCG
ncbi:hypothetical protein [Lentzea guizhouensis]|nr:hypothetical protein [Lentzea guizhouensis]